MRVGRADTSVAGEPRRGEARYGPAPEESAGRRGLAPFQWLILTALAGCGGAGVWLQPERTGALIVVAVGTGFVLVAVWRILLVILSAAPALPTPEPTVWPRYTVLAALYDEAEVVPLLVSRLARLDYPSDRLQGLLLLEAHDHDTIRAALAAPRPEWLELFIVPPGAPQTKPRALNHALEQATGEFLTVYDAEDEPDPGQLRAAAARFVADGSGRLACLQAPLRIRRPGTADADPFLDRQFAAEYAALFETALPGLARLGLPFPLGGTSNHFRTAVLKAVGGWDAWNVTEDADLGFRLWSRGWRLGVIDRPTRETPPGGLEHWLPQRVRWQKGYMQTWGVHTRRPWRLGARGAAALLLTVGAGLVSAALHGPSLAWMAAATLVAATAGLSPATPFLSLSVLGLGAAAAWLACAIGARRAGVPYGVRDMLAAPAYWSLLSLAFAHAAWRLVREPFAWDKTRHRPDAPAPAATVDGALDEACPQRLSAAHVAAPEPVA